MFTLMIKVKLFWVDLVYKYKLQKFLRSMVYVKIPVKAFVNVDTPRTKVISIVEVNYTLGVVCVHMFKTNNISTSYYPDFKNTNREEIITMEDMFNIIVDANYNIFIKTTYKQNNLILSIRDYQHELGYLKQCLSRQYFPK
jgi:hypothetical protein